MSGFIGQYNRWHGTKSYSITLFHNLFIMLMIFPDEKIGEEMKFSLRQRNQQWRSQNRQNDSQIESSSRFLDLGKRCLELRVQIQIQIQIQIQKNTIIPSSCYQQSTRSSTRPYTIESNLLSKNVDRSRQIIF